MRADIVIVGGGVTGLATACLIKRDVSLFEKEDRLGGCLRTDDAGGYRIDRTGHLLHFRDPYVRRVMFEELSIDWLHFQRRAVIHILGRSVPYPIQYNLHALPDVARTRCLDSYLAASDQRPGLGEPFERWSRMSYGDALHELFFEPYNRKLWQTDLTSMTAEWVSRFVPPADRELVVQGARGPHANRDFGYNSTFSYPRLGGTGTIVDALAETVRGPIHTCAELLSVDPIAKICEFSDGTSVRYKTLVSTIPLPHLLRRVHRVDAEVLLLSEGLRHNSVFYFAFGYRTAGRVPDSHWVYVPERRFSTYRVGTLSNYSPFVAPEGSILVCVEMGCPGDTAARQDVASLRARALEDLAGIGFVQPGWQLEFEHQGAIDCAYVIYDEHRRQALPQITAYLEHHGIYSIGRFGAWGYGSMGDALVEARDCARQLEKLFERPGRAPN